VGDLDQPRYLGRAIGYAQHPTVDPIECVDEAEQRRQTVAARREREQQQRGAWQAGRTLIVDGITVVKAATPAMPRRVVSTMRVVERAVARIDAELRTSADSRAPVSG
jgi:hypothetical protein